MEPTLTMILLWLLFGGAHIGLATQRVRSALVARFGEGGFTALFSVIASVLFAALTMYYAAHRDEGAAGLALGSVPLLGPVLWIATVAGFVLANGALSAYAGSPYDLFAKQVRAPRGIERISRHPFFAGLAVFALAHALLATHLVGTVWFGALALLSTVGPVHQDRKLLARAGKPYADYLAATSAIPFAAVLAGRQRVVWKELPPTPFAVSLVLALLLRSVHDSIFAAGGAWVIATVVGGAALISWQSYRRAQRSGGIERTAPASGQRAV